ncbi:unnamed protein product [Nesidiocoris tenuis]|uniref:Uncharacterized protein n=1 Tax=Nesidiocoris tenuis TaxID=355587 RepID=A0A6H5HJ20_9HEMI|nr:unnamed protein product [Nesidiocoris tenuis]
MFIWMQPKELVQFWTSGMGSWFLVPPQITEETASVLPVRKMTILCRAAVVKTPEYRNLLPGIRTCRRSPRSSICRCVSGLGPPRLVFV